MSWKEGARIGTNGRDDAAHGNTGTASFLAIQVTEAEHQFGGVRNEPGIEEELPVRRHHSTRPFHKVPEMKITVDSIRKTSDMQK